MNGELMNISQPEKVKLLYRYTDGWRGENPFMTNLQLEKFEVYHESEKSYFIYTSMNDRRRVPKNGKNIYAWDTEEKALFNYFKRKERQASILSERLKFAIVNRDVAKRLLDEKEKYRLDNPTTTILEKIKEETWQSIIRNHMDG